MPRGIDRSALVEDAGRYSGRLVENAAAAEVVSSETLQKRVPDRYETFRTRRARGVSSGRTGLYDSEERASTVVWSRNPRRKESRTAVNAEMVASG